MPPTALTSQPPRSCCTFRIGDACFAVDAARVVEVLRGGALAPVPLAAAEVLGRLGVTSDPRRGRCPHLVVALGDDWYGLRVDEMLEVIDIPSSGVERPTAADVGGESLAGVYAAPTRLVHLLDLERMIHLLMRQPAHPPGRGAAHGQDH
jgi:chemotaxis signal transduction protein